MDDLAPDLDQEETDTPVPADDPLASEADLDDPLFEPADDIAVKGDDETPRISDDG